MSVFDESLIEAAALDYLREIGFSTEFGPNIGPGGIAEERASWEQVYLLGRLRAAGRRINPSHVDLVDDAIKRLQRAESQSELSENFRVHKLLVDGVPVEHRGPDGQVRTAYVRLVDFDKPGNNDWLAVNQFTIVQHKNRRPDVLVFVNGIPLALLELKNPANEHATLKTAWNQVQTYRTDIPAVFTPNTVTVISDGTSAAMSSFSGGFEHYAPWKTIDGRDVISNRPALEVLLKGVFDRVRLS